MYFTNIWKGKWLVHCFVVVCDICGVWSVWGFHVVTAPLYKTMAVNALMILQTTVTLVKGPCFIPTLIRIIHKFLTKRRIPYHCSKRIPPNSTTANVKWSENICTAGVADAAIFRSCWITACFYLRVFKSVSFRQFFPLRIWLFSTAYSYPHWVGDYFLEDNKFST